MMSEVVELDPLKIPLEAIRSATNNFAKENFIGGGGFGSVYSGRLQRSNGYLDVAVKRLDPDNGQGEHEFRNEIELLSCYKHENIVSLIGFCEEDGEMILVYEYAVHGSLYKQLKDGSARLTICIGVAHGLEYLHTCVGSQHRVIHRDIKSANILLDKNWEAKIADFGLSRIGPANQGNSVVMSNVAGTPGYWDPESLDFGILSKESDVYSFGVVLFEVLSGNDGKMYLAKWAKRCYKDGKLNNITDNGLSDHIKPESLRIFADVAFLCLKGRREERPTIGRVVEALENALKTQLGTRTDNILLWWAPALRKYLKKFHIPDYILLPDFEPEVTESTDGPSCPVLVFINSKCDLGVNLLATYRSLTLINDQIFDLEQESPDVVLRRLYLNLERLKVHGDKFALGVQERLRIIVAGDDETISWLVGVVSDMRLSRPTPIAAVHLGIENNLPFAFDWGKNNPGTDRASVFSFLDRVWTAKEMAIDSWHILMGMRTPTASSHDPIAPLEFPHSLHGFRRISSTNELNMELIKDQVANMYLWPRTLEVPILDLSKALKKPVGILHIKVLRAVNLKMNYSRGASEPYVKIKMTESKLPSKMTTVKHKNLNPEWDEEFTMVVKNPVTQAVELQVYDWEQVGKHDYVGMNVVPLKELTPDEPKDFTLELLKNMDPNDVQNEKARGQLVVELLYKFFKEEDVPTVEDLGNVEKAPEGTPASGGLLVVIVYEAEDVEGKHHTHLHVRVLFKGDERKTKPVKKDRDPRWYEEFMFLLEEPPVNDSLHVEVVSTSSWIGLLHPKETLGYVDISLADVVNNKRINEKYHLIDSKNGKIQIELQWRTSS